MDSAYPTPLQHVVAAARARYRERHPASAAQLQAAAGALPGGNTRSVLYFAPFPLTMVRGDGCRLWDADGHAYLDALGEFTAGIYGHSHPVIREALVDALHDGLSLSSHTTREAALALEIQRRFPSMELLRFTNSGTEANLMAVGLAKIHTGRRRILVFDGAYHGGLLAFSGGGSALNAPHDYLVGTYNDAQAAREIFRQCGSEIAAVLVEPMLGSGGCIPGQPEFLHELRTLSEAHGALLVFDEVMTSRLSAGGRQALLRIRPDLTTLGKYFGGGVSFGAFGGRREILQRFDPSRPVALAHAGTFNNTVLSMAAGLAGLVRVLSPDALATLNERGERLRGRVNEAAQRRGLAIQATGLGSLMTLHATDTPIRRPADAAAADPLAKELLFFDLLDRGIYLARRGFASLSLPFGDAEVEEFIAAWDAVLDERRAVLPARRDA